MRIEEIPISKIKVENHPRSETTIPSGFKKTIRKFGMVYPIVVTYSNVLIDGGRRLQALKETGYKKALVIKMSKTEKPELELILNLQREDLNPIDKAKAFKKFIKKHTISIRKASKILGVSKSVIEHHLKLLELPEDVQQKLEEGEVKPFSRSIEKGVHRRRIRTNADFNRYDSQTKYMSVLRRITALKFFIRRSRFAPHQLTTIRDNIIEVLDVISSVSGKPISHQDFLKLQKETVVEHQVRRLRRENLKLKKKLKEAGVK